MDLRLDVNPAHLSHDERIGFLERLEEFRSSSDSAQQVTLAELARENDAEDRSKEWVREELAGIFDRADDGRISHA